MGDIIFTFPALGMYRYKFPDHRIYYVVEEEFAELATIIPYINEMIIIPRNMGPKDLSNFRKKIKNLNIQRVIDFHSGPKSAILTRISGARERIGYRTPNRNWAYTHLVPRKFKNTPTHSVFNQVRLLGPLGIDSKNIPPYPIIPIRKEKTDKMIQSLPRSGPDVIIHIGAKTRFRDWGIKNYLSLIQLLEADGCLIYLLGQNLEERKRGEYLAKKSQVKNLTGLLSLIDILYLISRSRIYLGVDSGPLHLASLTTTPIVAIYGPNLPAISGPWRRENVKILQADLNCIPCSQKKCKFETVKCMQNVTVHQVYEAIKTFL